MKNPLTKRRELLARVREAFSARDSTYAENRSKYEAQCAKLEQRIDDREAQGEPMPCSRQKLLEAFWLVHYTCDWQRIGKQIADTKASLHKGQKHAGRQDAEGSWGACCTAWYRKLEPTVDELQLPGRDPRKIKRLKFLERLQDAAKVTSYLWALQISDIEATGVNHRDELGAALTALAQLLFKDQLHDLLHDNPHLGMRFGHRVEQAFCNYLAQTQHPQTGYWGPWYRFGDEVVIAHDLSFTFHVVNYRSGAIANWPQVIDTTLRIKGERYPFGWKPDDKTQYSLHNGYDVALIFAYGWPHMDWPQKKAVRAEMAALLAWCLTEAIDRKGSFKLRIDDAALETYYFGVRMLDTLGFWRADRRYWCVGDPPLPNGAPTPHDLCRTLKRAFDALEGIDFKSEEADTVRGVLNTAIAATSG